MSDNEQEMAERLPFPENTAFAVDYPGYVMDTEKALCTIGGSEKLARNINEDVGMPIELRYRYKDPTSHPIKGEIVSTQNLLIKVTRRVKKSDRSVVDTSAKVMALIDKSVRFRTLADFQYIVNKSDPLAGISDALSNLDIDKIKQVGSSEAFDQKATATNNYVPAPFLDQYCLPVQLRTRFSVGTSKTGDEKTVDEEARERQPRSSNKPLFHGISIKYSDKTVPEGPTPEAREDRNNIPSHVLERVEAILAQQPVISRNAMEILLPASECNGIKNSHVLPIFAYLMDKGPWRSCWIRFGYDPRKNPEARMYQILDMRMKSTKTPGSKLRNNKRGSGRVPATENQPLNAVSMHSVTYNEESARQRVGGIFQLLHIEIPLIKELVAYERGWRNSSCEESGWLQPSLLQLIRRKLRVIRKYYEDGAKDKADTFDVNYSELDKQIDGDREKEAEAEATDQLIAERERNAAEGPSQILHERLNARVDTLMRQLETQDHFNEDELDSDDDFAIYE
ncbi:tau 95 subunit of transcription factor TFIIIC [Coemansia sp. RSA 1290]|nr:tau 95 subunit of transcription factor TFIIIC [Coemansia sp. RSA 1290]KAJ2652501.1 tau 95 subunit of transcription factor TFIIIC [Coemansia sp. RSA 1250]